MPPRPSGGAYRSPVWMAPSVLLACRVFHPGHGAGEAFAALVDSFSSLGARCHGTELGSQDPGLPAPVLGSPSWPLQFQVLLRDQPCEELVHK